MRTRQIIHNTPALVAFHLGYIYGDNCPEGFLKYYKKLDDFIVGFDDTCDELGAPMPDLEVVRAEFSDQVDAWKERARVELEQQRENERQQLIDRDEWESHRTWGRFP